MRWWTRHAPTARDLLQDYVPDRVLAAGRVRTPGTAATGDPPARAGRAELPTDGVWLAVSATRLYAFAATGNGVGELVEAWDRAAITVTRAPRLTGTRLALRFGTNGTPIELDAPRRAGQRTLVRYLVDARRTT